MTLRKLYDACKRLPTRVYLDLAADDVVFISGSGRSGTSWLADLCNYQNEFRYVFEPFNPSEINSAAQVPSWCPDTSASCPAIDAALTGRIRSRWSDSSNRKLIARRRLIKGIRSNLMLSWIAHHYPRAKLVQIYRNPLAVAASRKNLAIFQSNSSWEWRPTLQELLQDPGVNQMLEQSHRTALQDCIGGGIVLETVADWCINNLLVMPTNNVYRVFYEDLTEHPKKALQGLFHFIDVEYSDSIMSSITRPSHTSRAAQQQESADSKSTIAAAGPSWAHSLDNDESAKATELLQKFDVNRLYSSSWQPINNVESC